MWHSTSMDSTATGWPRVCILWRGAVSCPVSAAWHFCVAAHWSKYHCYKQAPSWYDLRCFKATLNPNKQTNTWRVILNPNWDYSSDSLSVQIKRIWIKIVFNLQILEINVNPDQKRFRDSGVDISSLTKASVCTKPWLTMIWLCVF